MAITALSTVPATAAGGEKAVAPNAASLVGASPEVLALMATQQRIDKNADRIEAVSRDNATSGLSGITVDAEHNSLQVYWHGDVPADVLAIIDEIRSGGDTVTIEPAPYTLTQLVAERDRLASLHMGQKTAIGPKSGHDRTKV